MANPYKRYCNVNGVDRTVENDQCNSSLHHNNISHPVWTDKKYVNPMHLVNNGAQVQYRSLAENRPAQSVQVVIPSPYREAGRTNAKSTPPVRDFAPASASPPFDYHLLLLSLAEDYFAAAHGAGSMLALVRRQSDILEYQKLVATGLSCLEASLKVFLMQHKLKPRLND